MAAIKRVKTLPEDIVDHPHLRDATELDLSGSNLVSLPDRFGELNLKELRLSRCKALTMDVEINKVVEMKNLTTLDLSFTNISALTERIGDLKALTELDLRRCENLTSLPERFGECKALKTLKLEHCTKLASLPERI